MGTASDRAVLGSHTGAVDAPGPGLIASRAALLDVLDALDAHREALVVVGAHAVYEHTLNSGLSATVTVDAVTMVVPRLVAADHSTETALIGAGLHRRDQARPGIYVHPARDATVDLICPEAVAGAGRRGARIVGQSKQSVGRAVGLELALADHDWKTITALDGSGRSANVKIAGTAAMLCAKAHKLADRFDDVASSGKPERLRPKDAADVWRLMKVSDPRGARAVFDANRSDPSIGQAVDEGCDHLINLFAQHSGLLERLKESLTTVEAAGADQFINDWMTEFAKPA
ncbi:hypothetical protein BH24ACT5_BH24ACT5_03040 [soil metagenome]